MTNEAFSVILHCRYDRQTASIYVQTARVDTGENIPLRDGSFLLRISVDEEGALLRCLIRHLPTGREAHIQSSVKLRAFVQSCLLQDQPTLSTDADTTE